MNTDNLNNIWSEFLSIIEKKIDPMMYQVWFENTQLIELNDTTAKLLVPEEIHKIHISKTYNDLVEETFTEVTGSNFKIEYITKKELEENKVKKVDNDSYGVPSDALFETNLKPEYTFDNFVAGNGNNQVTKAISLSVAQNPGEMYNPLYIYGPSGLGKTHLMQAIGNYITTHSNKRVLYVTSEKFVNDFMELYKKKSDTSFSEEVTAFKKKYRNLDVLIIDDIQYLETVGVIQQEFFNTFQELHQNNKQIILASDRSPDDLKRIEERLRTRFRWGMLVTVIPPDFDVRMEIIDIKLENFNLNVNYPQDVKEYIASNFASDVRQLEMAIKRVFIYATINNGAEITYDLAVQALKDFLPSHIISKNKIDLLQKIICEKYSISIEDIRGNKRSNEIAYPRQIAMYIARNYIKESLPKIGSEFGGKDHTTVMYSVNKIEKEVKTNSSLQEEINKIVEKLNVEKL